MSETAGARSLADLGLTAQGGAEARITGLSVDSRDVEAGHLFAALPGSNLHGGEFIGYALRMGASAVLTDAEGEPLPDQRDGEGHLHVRGSAVIERYFGHRDELAAVVLIVDIRRGLGELDQQLLNWVTPRFLPVHVLLTKADKLSRNAAKQALFQIERELKAQNPLYTAQLFSATAKQGVDEARARISDLLRGEVAAS